MSGLMAGALARLAASSLCCVDYLTKERSFRMTPQKLTLSAKLSRLRGRLGDPEWRRYGYILLSAKFIGIALVLGLILVASTLLGSHAVAAQDAADTPALAAADIVNPVNTA